MADGPDIVLIDGAPSDAVIPIQDPMVTRGDGCFEAVRSYEGYMIGLDEHLDRLEVSARALEIRLPERGELRAWMSRVADARGDGVIRMLVSADKGETSVVVFSTPVPPIPPSYRLLPVGAPWHPGGAQWDLAGVKTLSYAPNMAATRTARRDGFDDALLFSRDGFVLEAPTAGVFWVVDGVLETASVDLGILASVTMAITMDLARDAGIPVDAGRFVVERLDAADEVAALSTTREIVPVVALGERRFEPGPVTATLVEAYENVVGNRAR